MKEIVVISGKGGTGKTSLSASFAALSDNFVIADCDVDAADLHLVLKPDKIDSHRFISGNVAVIDKLRCEKCGKCLELCKFDAIKVDPYSMEYSVDSSSCEGCGVCARFCPFDAIDFPERDCGEWYLSSVKGGKMVHARLNAGAENSGKLVSLVRKVARKEAQKMGSEIVIVDGPPGISCPVIASVTGADAVLAVTEPTISGESDLIRVADLVRHFKIPLFICVNKWDINQEKSMAIESYSAKTGAFFCGKIPYDKKVVEAQIKGLTVVEMRDSYAGEEIKKIWEILCRQIL
ncbi:ATP-binding protein [candidate division WOR-3 bacterium]|nr:ATP-binding protein [candidate division WOR-3 bacterium]